VVDLLVLENEYPALCGCTRCEDVTIKWAQLILFGKLYLILQSLSRRHAAADLQQGVRSLTEDAMKEAIAVVLVWTEVWRSDSREGLPATRWAEERLLAKYCPHTNITGSVLSKSPTPKQKVGFRSLRSPVEMKSMGVPCSHRPVIFSRFRGWPKIHRIHSLNTNYPPITIFDRRIGIAH
jgi:hypothetical protein